MLRYPLYHISHICNANGIKKAVISPGSRNAPITISFARNDQIEKYIIPDERAAGFIALGLAQASNEPVALVCTSGSALLNYGPAIAEAYYQKVPLVVISADRPPEWIDQWDGQTIHQYQALDNHVKKSYQLPVSPEHADEIWSFKRMLSEAIGLAQTGAKGPVHINVPVREPFYPEAGEKIEPPETLHAFSIQSNIPAVPQTLVQEITDQFNAHKKILIVLGQRHASPQLDLILSTLPFPVVADIISNGHGIEHAITLPDNILAAPNNEKQQMLAPDILITLGQSVISKNLKLFLRKHPPSRHIHLDEHGAFANPFQALSDVIHCHPEECFVNLNECLNDKRDYDYASHWQEAQKAALNANSNFTETEKAFDFSEIAAVAASLPHLPQHAHLHLANSMSVRYANYFGLQGHNNITVFANRGTSGIDGCVSTAVGTALHSKQPTFLLVGDLAFFYDRNALWHNHLPSNLHIILLNNHAGGIFRMINGPAAQPELEDYFETHQKLNAQNTCKDFGITYYAANTMDELETAIADFVIPTNGPKLLEIETDKISNKEAFVRFKQFLHEQNLLTYE